MLQRFTGNFCYCWC